MIVSGRVSGVVGVKSAQPLGFSTRGCCFLASTGDDAVGGPGGWKDHAAFMRRPEGNGGFFLVGESCDVP